MEDLFWFAVNLGLGALIVLAYYSVKRLLTRRGQRAVAKDFAGPPETPEDRTRRELQERRDTNRATWKVYDAALDAQRAALEAAGAPLPYMLCQSTQDYLWYVHRAHIHMPWRYNNYTTNHLDKAPVDFEPLEWGWLKVGVGQRTKSDAETILARVIRPDENYYLYDATGLAQGYVPKPVDEEDHDA